MNEILIERMGLLIYEYESKRTLDGQPVPSAKDVDQDVWYDRLARQWLEALHK